MSNVQPKRPKQPKAAGKISGKDRSAALRAASKIPRQVKHSLQPQMQALASPLTHQDEAILGYLTTIADPFVETPAGVPLVLGSGGVITVKAAIPRVFTVKANSSGFGFLTMNADGWIGSDDTGQLSDDFRYASYSGGTQGFNVWYTDGVAAFAGTTLPNYVATTATTGLVSSATPLVDGSWTANTHYRMVAMGLQIWSEAPLQTAQGTVYVVSTSEPYGAAAGGALINTTEAILTTLNRAIVSVESAPLSGWVSGHVMSTSAVPSDSACFSFNQTIAVGSGSFGYPQIAVIMTGAATGQPLKVKTIFVYEYEKTQTNNVGDIAEPAMTAPSDRVNNGLNHIAFNGPSNPPGPLHPSGIHGGKGIKAFVDELKHNNPTKLLSLAPEIKRPSIDWGATAKHALGFARDRLSNFLPSWAGGLLKGATSLLGI